MTPVEAQALLDKIKGTDAAALQAYMDWKDVSDALTTIADMRYEYLVAVGPEHSPAYATMNSQGRFVGTTLLLADRWATEGEAQSLVDELREGNENSTARVMARLASDGEVVE